MTTVNPNTVINLEVNVEEYNFLQAVLGDLPTKSNAWVLRNRLETQAAAQLNKPAPEAKG